MQFCFLIPKYYLGVSFFITCSCCTYNLAFSDHMTYLACAWKFSYIATTSYAFTEECNYAETKKAQGCVSTFCIEFEKYWEGDVRKH